MLGEPFSPSNPLRTPNQSSKEYNKSASLVMQRWVSLSEYALNLFTQVVYNAIERPAFKHAFNSGKFSRLDVQHGGDQEPLLLKGSAPRPPTPRQGSSLLCLDFSLTRGLEGSKGGAQQSQNVELFSGN